MAFHTIFWTDLYLSGLPEEEFALPAPFINSELDSEGGPIGPYMKEQLLVYLADTRRKCHDTLIKLTDERANQLVEYPWTDGRSVTFLELQLYNMRHTHEHTAQLSLFLGQHAIPDEVLDWIGFARE